MKKRKGPIIDVRPIIGKTQFDSFWDELTENAELILEYDVTCEHLLNLIKHKGLPDCKVHQPSVDVINLDTHALVQHMLEHFQFNEEYEKCKILANVKYTDEKPTDEFLYNAVTVLSMDNNYEVMGMVIPDYGMYFFCEGKQAMSDTDVDGPKLIRRLMEYAKRIGDSKIVYDMKMEGYYDVLLTELLWERKNGVR